MADRDIAEQLLTRARAAVRPLLPRRWRSDIPLVPVVRLSGSIGLSTPLRPGLSLGGVARPLERAFGMRGIKAVALQINSPGGSPVQSHLIYLRIRQLSAEKGVRVIAFAEDVAASGGYMIACAADEIVCDASSIVGSIGVVGGSFGFARLLDKIGIERRLYTSGERKAMLDPFLPEKTEDVERLKSVQREIHQDFIALVRERRGARLVASEVDLFSGEFWTGRKAVELGLADAVGDLRSTLRRRFGDDVATPLISPPRSWLGRPQPGIGTLDWRHPDLAAELLSAIEARAMWARYGL
jgi:serine protease SohB